MVMPWLTVLLVPQLGYAALFMLFAVLALLSAGLLATFVQKPQSPTA
jgi:membrane protein implicated in regulation of membrane protease activity